MWWLKFDLILLTVMIIGRLCSDFIPYFIFCFFTLGLVGANYDYQYDWDRCESMLVECQENLHELTILYANLTNLNETITDEFYVAVHGEISLGSVLFISIVFNIGGLAFIKRGWRRFSTRFVNEIVS